MKFPYSTDYFPPAPELELWIGESDAPLSVGPLRALVDSGADVTIVPVQYVLPLAVQVDDRKYLRTQWGDRKLVDIYFLDVGIGDMRFPCVEIIADDEGDDVILGRNLLNKLVLILNGPQQELDIAT